MSAVLERTTKEDQRIAKSSILKLRETSKRVTRGNRGFVNIRIQKNGDLLKIPKKALYLLVDILNNMAEGRSITIVPSDAEISTQQAADMLNISRPHLVKLLENGEIPFKKVGTHRRVDFKDIIAYEKKLKEMREENLDFLSRQAQDLNLGY
jgi:excisionase family DNA binding protein